MGNTASTTATTAKAPNEETLLQIPAFVTLKTPPGNTVHLDPAEYLTVLFRPDRMIDANYLAGILWKSRKGLGKLIPDALIYPKWRQDLTALADLSRLLNGQPAGETVDGLTANRIVAIYYSISDLERLVAFILGVGGAVRVLGRISAILGLEGLTIGERHGLIVRAVEARLEVLEGLYQHLDLFRLLELCDQDSVIKHGLERCKTGICLMEGLLETAAVVPGIEELSVILWFLHHHPNHAVLLTRAAQRETEEGLFRFLVADLGRWMVGGVVATTGEANRWAILETAYRSLKRIVEADALGLIIVGNLELKATLYYLYGRACLFTGRPVAGVEHLRRAAGIVYGLMTVTVEEDGKKQDSSRDEPPLLLWDNIIQGGPGSLRGLLDGDGPSLVGFLYHCVLLAQAAKSNDAAIQLASFAMRVSMSSAEREAADPQSPSMGMERLLLLNDGSQAELHLVLGTVIIVGLIEEGRYLEAYESLNLVPEVGDRRRECLRRLIVAICEGGQAHLLGQLPLIPWLSQVERILLLRAREMPVLLDYCSDAELLEGSTELFLSPKNTNNNTNTMTKQPNYYKILYSFYANRGDYRSAANAIYQYVDRLRCSSSIDIEAMIGEVVVGLNLAVTTLRLVAEEYRWLAFAKPSSTATHATTAADPSDRLLCIIDLDRLRGEVAVAMAVQRLLRHFRFKGNPLQMTDPSKLLMGLLTEAHEYRAAIDLAHGCQLEWNPILTGLVDEIIGVFEEKVVVIDWLEGWFEERGCPIGAMDGLFLVLRQIFTESAHPPASYRLVLERMICRSSGRSSAEDDRLLQQLPEWFYEWFMENDPDLLVRLLLRNGHVRLAFQFAVTGLSIRVRRPKSRLSPTTVDAVLAVLSQEDASVLLAKWKRYSRLLLNFDT